MKIIFSLGDVKILRDALRERGNNRILTSEEYDIVLYLNARIEKEDRK